MPLMKSGQWVTAHLKSGDYPAVVTRANVDESVSITVFKPGEMVFADNVGVYVPDEDDEPEDRVGFFSIGLE